MQVGDIFIKNDKQYTVIEVKDIDENNYHVITIDELGMLAEWYKLTNFVIEEHKDLTPIDIQKMKVQSLKLTALDALENYQKHRDTMENAKHDYYRKQNNYVYEKAKLAQMRKEYHEVK